MIFPSNRVRIMVATKPVDFRKGHASYALQFSCRAMFMSRGAVPSWPHRLITASFAALISTSSILRAGVGMTFA